MSASQLLELRKANREKFSDVSYQLRCLKECYETISNDSSGNASLKTDPAMKELLEALERGSGNQVSEPVPFLPPPGQGSVLLLFDSHRRPHFEFDIDDQRLYSAAIYEKVIAAKLKAEAEEKEAEEARKKAKEEAAAPVAVANNSTAAVAAAPEEDEAKTASAAVVSTSTTTTSSATTSNSGVDGDGDGDNGQALSTSISTVQGSSSTPPTKKSTAPPAAPTPDPVASPSPSPSPSLSPSTFNVVKEELMDEEEERKARMERANESSTAASSSSPPTATNSSTQGQNSGSSNSSDTSNNNNTNKRPAPVDDDNFPSAPFHLLPLPAKRPLPLSSLRSSSPVPEFPTSEPSFMVGPPSISDLYHSAPSSPGPPLSPSDAAIGDAFLQSSTFANATTKDRLNCPICSTALIKISLPEHIHTVHLGRKPYVCRVDSCNFTTGYHSSIKCHLREVHKVHGEIELYYEYLLPGMSAAGEK